VASTLIRGALYPNPKELSDSEKAAYLLGFFEGNGSASNSKKNNPRIDFQTTSRQNIELWMEFLSSCANFVGP